MKNAGPLKRGEIGHKETIPERISDDMYEYFKDVHEKNKMYKQNNQ